MSKIRIRLLPNWPPGIAGTLELPGGNFAVPEDEKTRLKMVYPKSADGTVTFLGEFEGHDFAYDYVASSEEIAKSMRETLRDNIGASISELGKLEIENT
jgi:hypothetical protein